MDIGFYEQFCLIFSSMTKNSSFFLVNFYINSFLKPM